MNEQETYHNQDRLWSRGPSIDIFFLSATEPLNHLLARTFMELHMYTTEEGVLVGPMLYADDKSHTPSGYTGVRVQWA